MEHFSVTHPASVEKTTNLCTLGGSILEIAQRWRGAPNATVVQTVPPYSPCQGTLHRVGSAVDVVPVQAEPGLKPQRVAGPQARHLDAGDTKERFR